MNQGLPFQVRARRSSKTFEGQSYATFEVQMRGSLHAPTGRPNFAHRTIVNLDDVTDSSQSPLSVLCTLEKLQAPDSRLFLYVSDIERLPYADCIVEDWVTLLIVPVDLLILPRSGDRKLQFTVHMVAADGLDEFVRETCYLSYHCSEPGYLDLHDRRTKFEELSVLLLMAVCAADGNYHKSEANQVKEWVSKTVESYNKDFQQKHKRRLNDAIDAALRQLKSPKGVKILPVCHELAELAPVADLYSLTECILRIVASDNDAALSELRLVDTIVEALGLDSKRFRAMTDKFLPVEIIDAVALDADRILGLDRTASLDEQKTHLRKEMSKWNSRVVHKDSKIRDQAEQMLELIAKMRSELDNGVSSARNSKAIVSYPADVVVGPEGVMSPLEEEIRRLRERVLLSWQSGEYERLATDIKGYQRKCQKSDPEIEQIQSRLPAKLYLEKLLSLQRSVHDEVKAHRFKNAISMLDAIPRRPSSVASEDRAEIDVLISDFKKQKRIVSNKWLRQIINAVQTACNDADSNLDEARKLLDELSNVPVAPSERDKAIRSLSEQIKVAQVDRLVICANKLSVQESWLQVIETCDKLLVIDSGHTYAKILKNRAFARLHIRRLNEILLSAQKYVQGQEFEKALRIIRERVDCRESPLDLHDQSVIERLNNEIEVFAVNVTKQWSEYLQEQVAVCCRRSPPDVQRADAFLYTFLELPIPDDQKAPVTEMLQAIIHDAGINLRLYRAREAFGNQRWQAVIDYCVAVLEDDASNVEAGSLKSQAESRAAINQIAASARIAISKAEFVTAMELCGKAKSLCEFYPGSLPANISDDILQLAQEAKAKQAEYVGLLAIISTAYTRKCRGRELKRAFQSARRALLLNPCCSEALSFISYYNRWLRIRLGIALLSAVAIVAVSLMFSGFLYLRKHGTLFDEALAERKLDEAAKIAHKIQWGNARSRDFLLCIAKSEEYNKLYQRQSGSLFVDKVASYVKSSSLATQAQNSFVNGNYSQSVSEWTEANVHLGSVLAPGGLTLSFSPEIPVPFGVHLFRADGAAWAANIINNTSPVHISLYPAVYTIVVDKENHLSHTQEVLVASGVTNHLPLSLIPLPGSLQILCNVTGNVFVDDAICGTTGDWITQVAPGSRNVRISASGYDDKTLIVDVTPNSRVTRQVQMSRQKGRLVIDVHFDQSVPVDYVLPNPYLVVSNRPVPHVSFPIDRELPVGVYDIDVLADQFRSQGKQRLTLQKGFTTRFRFHLTPAPASVLFVSNLKIPIEIWEGGERLGLVCSRVELSPFVEHTLVFVAKGYKESRQLIRLPTPGVVYGEPILIELEKE